MLRTLRALYYENFDADNLLLTRNFELTAYFQPVTVRTQCIGFPSHHGFLTAFGLRVGGRRNGRTENAGLENTKTKLRGWKCWKSDGKVDDT